jgi:uncharacterized membrane protein
MIDIYEHSKLVLSRYDHYYDSVNNKGTYYLTLNAFLIGAVFTAYTTFNNKIDFNNVIIWLMVLSVIAGFVSIIVTLLAINPFLKSGESRRYQSLIFFGSISKMKEHEFTKEFTQQNDEAIKKDMLAQIHQLSEGLCSKYNKLKYAAWIVAVEFALISIIVISIFTNN